MMFCPKCGSIILPKNNAYVCSCGYKVKSKKEESKIVDKVKHQNQDIKVVSQDEKVHPIVDEECPYCGNNKAEHWMVQIRSGDEPETSFFKCTKCHKKWKKNE